MLAKGLTSTGSTVLIRLPCMPLGHAIKRLTGSPGRTTEGCTWPRLFLRHSQRTTTSMTEFAARLIEATRLEFALLDAILGYSSYSGRAPVSYLPAAFSFVCRKDNTSRWLLT